VCVENVVRRDTGTVVQKELEQLGYLVQVFFANACQFGMCQSRSRVYIAGVLKEKVRVVYGPDCWSRWLEASWLV
jgi:site-specific DNA-cytosine methylase